MFKRERKLLIRLRSFPRLVENKLIFLHIMENGSNRAIPMNSMSIITTQSQRRQSGWILINSLKKSSLLIKIRINWDPYGNTSLSLKSHCCSLQGIGQLQKSISSFFKVYVFVFAKEKWSLFCWIWKEWPSASVWLFLKFEFRVLLFQNIVKCPDIFVNQSHRDHHECLNVCMHPMYSRAYLGCVSNALIPVR